MNKFIFVAVVTVFVIPSSFSTYLSAGKTTQGLASDSLFATSSLALEAVKRILAENDKPLTTAEKQMMLAFAQAVEGKVPPLILRDLQMRGIGYVGANQRPLSDDEKAFLKKNIAHIHILKFLAYLNLAEMELESLPDELAELTQLRFFRLQGNNFTQLPKVVDYLQDRKPGVMVDLVGNPLPYEVMLSSNQKSHELLFRDNAHTEIKIKHLEWKVQPEILLSTAEETYPLAPLAELITLCCNGDSAQHTAWKKSDKNLARLNKVFKEFTPQQVMASMAESPSNFFKSPLFGGTPAELQAMLVGVVLSNLKKCGLVQIIRIFDGQEEVTAGGAAGATSENKASRYYDSIAGWSRYFTKEPVLKNKDTWLTAEGVQVLFNLAALFANYFHADIHEKDCEEYIIFNDKYRVPFRLSEDIRLHRSIGVRAEKKRVLSISEREWVIKHLDKLSELTFIEHLNLENMELTRLPDNFEKFKTIENFYLSNNKFTLIPRVCAYHLARNPEAVIDMKGDNKLRDKATEKFDAQMLQEELRFDEERIAQLKESISPSNVKIDELSWHPELLKRLGGDRLPTFKPLAFEPSKDCEKWRTTFVEWDMLDIVADIDKEIEVAKKKHEKQIASHDLKFIHAFFEFMMREAEEFECGIKTNEFVQTDQKGSDDDDDAVATQTAEELENEKVKAQNKAWLDDPFHKRMILAFLSKYSPAEAINLFKSKGKILKILLAEKEKREEARAESPDLYPHFRDESELTPKSLFDRTEPLFVVLLSHLSKTKKVVDYSIARDEAVVKKECLGFSDYYTVEPDVEKQHRGWLKAQGFAELLVTLEFAKAAEVEHGGAAAAATTITTTTKPSAKKNKKNRKGKGRLR